MAGLACGERLGYAGYAFDEYVSAGEYGGKHEVGYAFLSDDDVGNSGAYAVDLFGESGEVGGCGSCVHFL